MAWSAFAHVDENNGGTEMRANEVIRRPTVAVTPDTPIKEAAALMNEHAVGSVVVVDGSPSSVAALRWSAREAELRHDGLTAVCCWTFPVVLPPAPAVPALNGEALADTARQILKDAIENGLGADADRLDITTEV